MDMSNNWRSASRRNGNKWSVCLSVCLFNEMQSLLLRLHLVLFTFYIAHVHAAAFRISGSFCSSFDAWISALPSSITAASTI